jgi:hypothetical protein
MTIDNNSVFGEFTLAEISSGRLPGDVLNKETSANYGQFGARETTTRVDSICFSNNFSRISSILARDNLAAMTSHK